MQSTKPFNTPSIFKLLSILLVAILSGCTSAPEKVGGGNRTKFRIYVDKVELNLAGLSEQEDELADALAKRAPESGFYADAWNEKVKTYQASCAYYRKVILADVEMIKQSVETGLVSRKEAQQLIARSVQRNLEPYLKSMMVHGVDVGLTRTFIEVQFMLLQEIVQMELGETEFDLEKMEK